MLRYDLPSINSKTPTSRHDIGGTDWNLDGFPIARVNKSILYDGEMTDLWAQVGPGEYVAVSIPVMKENHCSLKFKTKVGGTIS